MARVTVEDCVVEVPNRFELVALASRRAKNIASGVSLTVDRDNDKDSVVALREIAGRTVSPDALREEVIQSLQTQYLPDVPATSDEDIEISSEFKEEVQSLAVIDEDSDNYSLEDENLNVDD